MGRGQRHSKNAGGYGTEAFTYAERKALGFGTIHERLGKDSQGNYYDCCLTLQPVTDPVVTPDGYLYSREAIVENLLQQKKLIKRKIAEWEAEQAEAVGKQSAVDDAARDAALVAFDRKNHCGASARTADGIAAAIAAEAAAASAPGGATRAVNIKEYGERMKTVKAFWMPSQVEGGRAAAEKPDAATYCPASGKKLRLKDLTPVRFARVAEGEPGLYMDPVTREPFGQASRLVAVKPTGDVMLKSTYEAVVKPEGKYEGARVREARGDVIALAGGASGFAARDGDKAAASKHYALGQGSGRADIRGQNASAASRFGLRFQN